MAARPAPDKDARPPARPPPRPGPKRKDYLPITESLLFPRIHYHQCPAVCVCVGEGESGREAGGRARAREAGGRAAGSPGTRTRRALGGSPHLPVTGARAPGPSPSVTTAYGRPGRRHQLHRGSASRGGGGESPCSGPAQTASTSSTFPSSGSATACPPPPAAAAGSLKLAASCRCRCRCYRRRRSTNYIRATRPWPPSEKLGSFRHTPLLPTPRGLRTPPSANLG